MIRSLILVAILLLDLVVFVAVAVHSDPIPSVLEESTTAEHVPIPEASPEAIRYQQSSFWLWGLGRAWAVAIPVIFLFTGWSGRVSRFTSGRNRPWIVATAVYLAIYLGFEFALKFPLRYYAGFVRLHEYGLSTQTFGRWLGDAFKGLGVEIVGAGLFAWVPFWLMARSPRRWWLYTGLLILPFSVGSAFLAPIVVDPLFNKFGPMHDQALEAKIKDLARRAGIEGGDIFEVDKSRDTKTVNAYVTGMFGTKRIVLWDTLLQKLDEREVEVVMGHEMGHYVLNHVALGVTLGSLGTLVVLYVIATSVPPIIARHSGRFGFDGIADVGSIPLLLIGIEVLLLLTSPIANITSRTMEHEADRFALELTRDNHAAATGFAKLQTDNLSTPYSNLFTTVVRSSHPSIGDRITFCNTYRPWEFGLPLRYADRFQKR